MLNYLLGLLNLKIIRKTTYLKFLELNAKYSDFMFTKMISTENLHKYFSHLPNSKSQLRQDLFVLNELNFKTDGFFVEFGACDGTLFSNTFLLEKNFGWHGILGEPAITWHDKLIKNRSAKIEKFIIWKDSGKSLKFREVTGADDARSLSSILFFSNSDNHAKKRKTSFKTYEVNTISLIDMLDKHNAPNDIDYISIDTEGSEYEILSSFDFSRYNVKIFTIEHNYTKNREKIFSLLTKHGYTRKYPELSQFDDWYVKS